jgi:ABC-type Fe3+-hydroxamate transport system substrate-binding protein
MFLQKVFREIREGISDEEVASYIFDVVFAIANLESIEYSQLLSQILSDVQVLTPTETTEWIRLMRYPTTVKPKPTNIRRGSSEKAE